MGTMTAKAAAMAEKATEKVAVTEAAMTEARAAVTITMLNR